MMKSTDPYFLLFRGLLRHLSMKGVIDQDDATAIVSEALSFTSENGDDESADLLSDLEKLMTDSSEDPARGGVA